MEQRAVLPEGSGLLQAPGGVVLVRLPGEEGVIVQHDTAPG